MLRKDFDGCDYVTFQQAIELWDFFGRREPLDRLQVCILRLPKTTMPNSTYTKLSTFQIGTWEYCYQQITHPFHKGVPAQYT